MGGKGPAGEDHPFGSGKNYCVWTEYARTLCSTEYIQSLMDITWRQIRVACEALYPKVASDKRTKCNPNRARPIEEQRSHEWVRIRPSSQHEENRDCSPNENPLET